jgi:adenylate cyclase
MVSVEAPPLERKLVAILAADFVGYSRLMHENEEHALSMLSSHRSIIDGLIATARGEIAGTGGDSVLAEFASVVDAANCAVAIQQALTRANAATPKQGRMELRIGINVGDVMVKDGTIFGDGVNVACRVQSIADPGGVCVTRGVRDQLRDRVDFRFNDLGEQSVKNIARPVRVFSLVFDPTAEAVIQRSPNDDPASAERLEPEERPEPGQSVEVAFWQSVEASNDPAEYRAYLERYPEGEFASLAAKRIIDPPTVSAERIVEVEFWNSVKDSDQAEMIAAYLGKYPKGVFVELATLRLSELRGGSRDNTSRESVER